MGPASCVETKLPKIQDDEDDLPYIFDIQCVKYGTTESCRDYFYVVTKLDVSSSLSRRLSGGGGGGNSGGNSGPSSSSSSESTCT